MLATKAIGGCDDANVSHDRLTDGMFVSFLATKAIGGYDVMASRDRLTDRSFASQRRSHRRFTMGTVATIRGEPTGWLVVRRPAVLAHGFDSDS